jgi:hypothetical protein
MTLINSSGTFVVDATVLGATGTPASSTSTSWLLSLIGEKGSGTTGDTGEKGNSSPRGNTAVVDAIYGNDSSGSIGGPPFLTIAAAVNAVISGQAIWVLPGTYTLTSGIVLPNGVSIRGLSQNSVIINYTGSDTMITMGEHCSVEDMTLNRTDTSGLSPLTGVEFGGTSSQTSTLRSCALTILSTESENITAVLFDGSGIQPTSSTKFNSIDGCVINVYSSGQGEKRGILVTGPVLASVRDSSIYVGLTPGGILDRSYIGVEAQQGSIQLRSSTIYGADSDIRHTNSSITSNTYFQSDGTTSPGIYVGPGTELVSHTAGGEGFYPASYSSTIYYGLKGLIANGSNNGFLWPGTQVIAAGVFPDPTIDPCPAYYTVQSACLLTSVVCSLRSPTTSSNDTVTFQVMYTPVGSTREAPESYALLLAIGQQTAAVYDSSIHLNPGDRIHVQMYYTGSGNIAADPSVQINLF